MVSLLACLLALARSRNIAPAALNYSPPQPTLPFVTTPPQSADILNAAVATPVVNFLTPALGPAEPHNPDPNNLATTGVIAALVNFQQVLTSEISPGASYQAVVKSPHENGNIDLSVLGATDSPLDTAAYTFLLERGRVTPLGWGACRFFFCRQEMNAMPPAFPSLCYSFPYLLLLPLCVAGRRRRPLSLRAAPAAFTDCSAHLPNRPRPLPTHSPPTVLPSAHTSQLTTHTSQLTTPAGDRVSGVMADYARPFTLVSGNATFVVTARC